ncbi:hypothetical protein DIPPA_24947 [Diplonema papillatum]|nr:hypothetical protein DIPPA_24947 [Diplonema papillatum]
MPTFLRPFGTVWACCAVLLLAAGGEAACVAVTTIRTLETALEQKLDCATWLGFGAADADASLSVSAPFELVCPSGTAIATSHLLVFTVANGVELRFSGCVFHGDIVVEGGATSGSLRATDVSFTGALALSLIHTVHFDRVSCFGSVKDKPALQSLLVQNFEATELSVADSDDGCAWVTGSQWKVTSLSLVRCSAFGGLSLHEATLDAGSLLLENCTGGGATITQSSVTVTGTLTARGCRSGSGGGGMTVIQADVAVGNALFVLNSAGPSYGGAVSLGESGSLVVSGKLEMSSNTAGYGAGASISDSATLTAGQIVARCNHASETGHDLYCVHTAGSPVQINEFSSDVDDSLPDPSLIVVGAACTAAVPPARGSVFSDRFTASAAPFFGALAFSPSRGICTEVCPANGYTVQVNGVDLPSSAGPLEADFDAGGAAPLLPLSLGGIPRSMSAGATLHQTRTGGLVEADSLKLRCCSAAGPCEFFVSVYSCAACAGVMHQGLWPSLLAEDGWQIGPCAPSFSRGGGGGGPHPMKTFRAEVPAGETVALSAVGGGEPAFAVFARALAAPADAWCQTTPQQGPNLPSTCGAACYTGA